KHRNMQKFENDEKLDTSINELIKNLRIHYKNGDTKSDKINEQKIYKEEEILSNELKNFLKLHLEKGSENTSSTSNQKATSILSDDDSIDSSIQSLPPPLRLSFELSTRKDHDIQKGHISEDILKNSNYGLFKNLDEVPLAGEKGKINSQDPHDPHDKSINNQFSISSVSHRVIIEQQQPTLEVDDKPPQNILPEKQISGVSPSMPKIEGKNTKRESVKILNSNLQKNVKNSMKTTEISDEDMPDYTLMSLEELKVMVSKYGIRPSSRNIMIKQLQILWKSLSKVNTGNLDTSKIDILPERQKKQSTNSITKPIVISDDALSESDGSEDGDLPLLDLIDSLNTTSEEYLLEEEMAKQISDYISSNKRLWLSILEYQDLNFDQILRDLNNAGIYCNTSQLRVFMDSR
ncbi:7032_t:CDS:2, partial [Ambispora leptoticha]